MNVILQDNNDKISAGLLLAGRIKEQISSNQLKVGQKLPTTDQLSKMMGVSSHTVQKAMEILGSQGLIEGAPGRGRYIASRQQRTNGTKSQEEQIRISIVNIFQLPEYGHPTDRFRIVSTEGVFSEASKLKISAVAVPEFCYTASAEVLLENMRQTSSQGVLWLYPTAAQWEVVRRLEESGIPVVITTRSRIDENCACVEGDYESGGYAIGTQFVNSGVKKMILFPGFDTSEKIRSQWPVGLHQGIIRAFGIINGQSSSNLTVCPIKNEENAAKQIADNLSCLNPGDGVVFVDSFHLFDYLQFKGDEAVAILNKLSVAVVANEHLLGKFLQYRDLLDFYVLKDPLKEIACFAVQKLAGLIQGYLANTSTLVKPSFERFKDMEIS